MKIILPLLLLLSAPALGQSTHKSELFKNRPDKEIINGILEKQKLAGQASTLKTTTTKRRIVAHTYTSYNILRDSTIYTYSFGRGSEHPNSNNYVEDFSPTYKDFRQPNIKYDEKKHWSRSGSNLMLTWNNTFKYDGANRAIEFRNRYASSADYTYALKYNTNNLPANMSETNAGVPQAVMYMSYDSQNERIADSSYNLIKKAPATKREYQYDANGNQTSFVSYVYDAGLASLQPSFRAFYGYDNNNRLISNYSEVMDNSTWVPLATDTFTYTGTAAQHTYSISYLRNQTTNEWEPEQKLIYQLNAQGNIDTYYIFMWSQAASDFDTLEKDVFYYGADHLLEYQHGFLYTGNGQYSAAPYDKSVFYWQTYDPTTVEKPATETKVIVYPNPSTGTIIVKAPAALTGDITVTNNMGQAALHLENVQLDGYAIDLGEHPAGTYTVIIHDNSGTIVCQTNISKV